MWLRCFNRYSRAEAESIMLAVRDGDLEEVQRLVQAHPKIVNASWPFLSNQFPLSEALLRGHEEMALYLIAHGASLSKGANQYGTLLHFAALSGLVKATEILITRRSNVNSRNFDKETPLHFATYKGHTETARLLIEHGAEVNAKDTNGRAPLHEAAETNSASVIELLISSGANVDVQDDEGNTPLQVAREKHNEMAIRQLDGKPR